MEYPSRQIVDIVRVDNNSCTISRCYKRDGISAIYPKGHEKYPEGHNMTYEEEFSRADGYWFHRNDIALLCAYDTDGKFVRHLIVEPTKNGIPTGDGIPYLTSAQWKWCVDENRRMIAIAKDWPEYGKAMRIM